MKTDYSRWMESVMKQRREDRIADRVQTILTIKALGLPYDITQEMILSYKYDLLEAKWRRHYRVVMYHIRSVMVSRKAGSLQEGTFSYWPNRPLKSRTWKPSRTS